MKRNHIIFAMAALSFAVSACENNRDNALPGATACFLAEGVLESAPFYVVDEDPAVTLRVFRSGYYAESLTVSVRSSESALETYNSENATAYKALPQSAYRIEPERITLAGDERSGAFQVIFDPMQLVGVEDPENLVVPVELLSDGNVSAKRNILLVHPNLEQIAVEIDEAATLFYITGENTYVNNAANAWDQTLTLKLARPFEADGTVALDCSQAALDAYNASHGTAFRLAPEGVVTFEAGALTIAKGETEVRTTIHVDPAKVGDEPCAVPVRLTSDYFEVAPEKSIYLLHFAPTTRENYLPINRYGWQCETTHFANSNNGTLMIDGKPGTYWDAPYRPDGNMTNPTGADAPPYSYKLDLRSVTEICAVALQARASQAKRIGAGYIEVSSDNLRWAKVAEFDNDESLQSNTEVGPFVYWFEPTSARFVRVTITRSNAPWNGYGFSEVSVAETFVYKPSDAPCPQRLAQSGWSADTNSYHNASYSVAKLIDGNVSTYWHTAFNGSSVSQDHMFLPFTVQIDMAAVQRLNGIEMWRCDNNGSIDDMKAGSFWVSETGDTSDWKNSQAWTQNGNWTKVGEFNFEKGISICRGPFCYLFPETQARYIRILITESNNKNTVRDCAQIAEIYALR